MKLDLYKKAKFALSNSLKKGSVNQVLVSEQLKNLGKDKVTQRLKLLRLYKKLVERKIDQESVVVQSSIGLDQASKKSLTKIVREKFGDKKIVFEVNSTILGGLRLIWADTTMDYSIAGKLSQFKETFK